MSTKLKDGDEVQILGTTIQGYIAETSADGFSVITAEYGVMICQPADLIKKSYV